MAVSLYAAFLARAVYRYAAPFSFVMTMAAITLAQSTQREFPTPITMPEISATIRSRDIGDARLTTHWYLLETGQGDLFLNIATRNLNADFDVFTFSNLAPVTKVVVFADAGDFETGRVLYFRKPEKLLLRVQGRTPGDEPATYRLKFAGSFVASRENIREPELPRATVDTEAGVRVNTVGTIIPTPRKVEPTRPATDVTTANEEKAARTNEPERRVEDTGETKPTAETKEDSSETGNEEPTTSKRVTTAANRRRKTGVRPAKPPAANSAPTEAPRARSTRIPANDRRRVNEPKRAEPPKADPLANVKLAIMFKDGTRIDKPLPEVLRFTVDRGMLTVIGKDGTIARYSMIDVAKVTIE